MMMVSVFRENDDDFDETGNDDYDNVGSEHCDTIGVKTICHMI